MASKIALGGGGREGKKVITRKGHTEREQQERRGESSESENKFSHTLLPGLHTRVKVWRLFNTRLANGSNLE